MATTVRYGSLPFAEAITYFKGKLNLPTERWNDVWQAGHNKSFMVAGAMKDDLLNDFRKSVDIAIAEGRSLNWFKKEFNTIVARHGWAHTGAANWRAKVIYDTNMRQSYNAGRWEQLQHFDYWEYRHGDSKTPRQLHLKWHGLTLHKSDPWWQTHMPQNGWGCKCKIYGHTERSMERKGLTPGTAPDDGHFEWTDKTTGEIHQVPKGIDPGFDYAPKKSENKRRLQQQAKIKAKVYQAPERLVPTAFSTVQGVDVHGLNKMMDQLKQSDAAPQVDLFASFIQQQNIKTVILKAREMSRGKTAYALADDIAQYLGIERYGAIGRYTVARSHKPEGFTSKGFNHVVIKAKASHKLAKVDMFAVREGIKNIIAEGAGGTGKHAFPSGKRWYAFAEATGDFEDNTSRFITWVHEMGHQVHYKAGMPARPTALYLTQYGNTNDKEWFAEHFCAWVLHRNELAKHWPEVAQWFDETMQQLIMGGS